MSMKGLKIKLTYFIGNIKVDIAENYFEKFHLKTQMAKLLRKNVF